MKYVFKSKGVGPLKNRGSMVYDKNSATLKLVMFENDMIRRPILKSLHEKILALVKENYISKKCNKGD